ncbi:MAG TPA: hypothetical protein VID27_13280, partial [Blastocatellia bacterium]
LSDGKEKGGPEMVLLFFMYETDKRCFNLIVLPAAIIGRRFKAALPASRALAREATGADDEIITGVHSIDWLTGAKRRMRERNMI